MNKINILFFLAFIITVSGCTEDRFYEENKDFPDKSWEIDETAEFEFTIEDNSYLYQLFLNLRNDVTYPYRNIYIQYTLKGPTANILEKELHNIQLFDPKTGAPYGDGISNVYSHQILLKDSMQFPVIGQYTVELDQYMRTDSLQGIYSVGIRLQQIFNTGE